VKQLSIALIRQRYAGDGGAERFVARALDALKARNVDVTLIAREWRDEGNRGLLRCNPFYIGRLWRDMSFARCVCRLLAKQQFDIVQSHERIACCDVYRAGDGVHREWLTQLSRLRGPVSRLGLKANPYHRYVLRAEERLFSSPRLRAVICNSNMVKDELRRHYGVPESKLHVIYSGVDTESYHPRLKDARGLVRRRHEIPEAARLFLFAGSGFERKGIWTLLAAMGKLPEDCYLLVVGRDKNMPHYMRVASALGLGKRAQFLGSQSDVKPYYGAADALVLPTLYDPFPNVALEAFASGLPVITSTKCGAAELIVQGSNGFVRDALDHEGLAADMQKLSEADQAVLSQAARATVADLDLEVMSQRLLNLYETLLPT